VIKGWSNVFKDGRPYRVDGEMGKDPASTSVLIIIAALNEEEGIGPTLAELREHLRDPRFLVVDGNSVDGTVEVARKIGVEVLLQQGSGKGRAIAQAIKHIRLEPEYLVLTDADHTYPAEYVPKMIEILAKNPQIGMVCGNRFNDHFQIDEMRNVLYTGNRMLAFVHNLLNGVQMRDPLTGLRVVRWRIFKDWEPRSKSFDIEVELNHQVERRGYSIVEIPIYYRQRLGEKKLGFKHGFTILKRMLLEFAV
jgi:dolichol-phosphate mannosyltransferase